MEDVDANIASIICAIIGGLCVAVPAIFSTVKTQSVTNYRIEQLEISIKELNKRFDRHEEHTTQIAALEIRMDAAEQSIKHLMTK